MWGKKSDAEREKLWGKALAEETPANKLGDVDQKPLEY